jgi:tRNA1(Val) A37 N6-methylase TrmN6
LCLGLRVPGLTLAGLEVQPDYAALARQNAIRNDMQFEVHEGDLAQMPRGLRRDFDHVLANPPYYAPGGSPSPVPGRARAMQITTPLGDWVSAAARRLRPGGWMSLICLAEGLPEVLSATRPRLGSVAVLPLVPREGRPALRILLQARKGGRAAFRLLSPLVIHQGAAHDGDRESYTPAANAVLRDGADLLALFSEL